MAARLAERDAPVTDEPRALLDERVSRVENFTALLAVLVILALMSSSRDTRATARGWNTIPAALVTDVTARQRYANGWARTRPYTRIVPASWATVFRRRAARIDPAPGPVALRLGWPAGVAVAAAILPLPE